MHVVGGRERHVRAIAHFGRALRALRRLDDFLRLQPAAGDPADRLIEHLAVVGQLLASDDGPVDTMPNMSPS